MRYKELQDWIKGAKENDKFTFFYKGNEYNFRCYFVSSSGEKDFTVERVGDVRSGMNVGKITRKYITLYTYDMMDQKSTYKMSLEDRG